MAINPFIEQDYLAIARSRVTEQLKYDPETGEGKDIFDRYLQLLLDEKIELQSTFKDLMQLRSLDTATGVNLDVIGEIVGQERTLLNVDIFEFFGFQGVPNAGSFGDVDYPQVGSIFYDSNNPRFGNITLDDDTYRIFIRAKIAKNVTRVTPEDIMSFANSIFSTTGSTIQDEGFAAYTLLIGKELSSFERSLLRYVNKTNNYTSYLVPKPIGVRVNYGNYDQENFFGFAGVPNAKGFGEYRLVAGGEEAIADGTFFADGTLIADGFTPRVYEINPDVGGKFAETFQI